MGLPVRVPRPTCLSLLTRFAGLRDDMSRTGTEHLLIGIGVDDLGASENSYLLAFGAYGVGMVVLCVVMVLVSLTAR